jgi:osmotically-inducible protein OsmY
MGIFTNPPTGPHPIHIIVNSGNVRLIGVVDTEGDKTIAAIQANTVSGVFSVTDELEFRQAKKSKN